MLSNLNNETENRRAWLSVLARMSAAEMEAAWSGLAEHPRYVVIRDPQAGMILLEGRAGGTGGRFNLGHASVSRSAIRLDSGEVGVGYCLGDEERKAELIAVFDALLQTSLHDELMRVTVEPAATQQQVLRAQKGRKAASSTVDFFTMVRGDNADNNLRK